MNLKEQFEAETGNKEQPLFRIRYLEKYTEWLESKVERLTERNKGVEITTCKCGCFVFTTDGKCQMCNEQVLTTQAEAGI